MHPKAQTHVDSVTTKAPADSILVSDADLLFNGAYKRAGTDLVITRDDNELRLTDYFKGDKHAPLASPDGAYLTGKIVEALTGYVQVAQADGSAAAAKIIGHVTKLNGNATVIRNGVSIILNNGDNVYQGDVVQSGSNSTVGITFIDGSVFGLASNARMVLNEMIYDPNGSNNSSLLSLVQGTVSFVAGATAKHGDMKVDTPVATMGIRGTAVVVEIDFEITVPGSAPPVRFQVVVEPDGTTGSFLLLDRVTQAPMATVNQAGTVTTVSGTGAVSFLASSQLSPEAMKLLTDVFSLKYSDANPKGTDTHFTDTVIPQTTFPIKLADGSQGIITVQVLSGSEKTSGPGPGTPPPPTRAPGPPGIATANKELAERTLLTDSSLNDTVTGGVSYSDPNVGDTPSVSASFSHFSYRNAAGQDVPTSALTATQINAIAAVSVPLRVVQDAGGRNNGTATWTYEVQDKALDFLAEGEKLTLTYQARVDNNFAPNNEFSLQNFTITITGTNDVPTVTATSSAFREAENPSQPNPTSSTAIDTVSGTITFADVDLTDTHAVTIQSVAASGETAGVPSNATMKAWLSLGTLTDSTDGVTGSTTWTFAAQDNYFDYLADGEQLVLTYTIRVDDHHASGVVEKTVTVTVTGTNDTPVVTTTDNAFHEASNPVQPNPTGSTAEDTVTGTISFTDVDLSDTHTVTIKNVSASGVVTGVPDNPTMFDWLSLDEPGTDSTGGVTGSTGWTFTAQDHYFDYLADEETVTFTYTVEVDDHHGGVVTKQVAVTVTGTNDAPVLAADVSGDDGLHSVPERENVTNDTAHNDSATGSLNFDDVDLSDTHTVSNSGPVFNWLDSSGNPLSLNVTQTNALTLASTFTPTLHDSTGTGHGSIDFSYSAADNNFDFLADGEKLTITYQITVSDDDISSTRPVTITIEGKNDVPVAHADVNEGSAVVESGQDADNNPVPGNDTASGNVLANDTDVDITDTHEVVGVATGTHTGVLSGGVGSVIVGTYGDLVLNDDGTWTYTLRNDYQATDALAQGAHVQDIFSYTESDHHGGTSTATLTIDVTGTNDEPITNAAPVAATDVNEGAAIVEQGVAQPGNTTVAGLETATGDVLANDYDVDTGDTKTVQGVASGTVSGPLTDGVDDVIYGTYGHVTIAAGGTWTYTLDNGNAATQALTEGQHASDVFTYTMRDALGSTSSATLTIDVTGTNDAPTVAQALTDNVDEGDAAFTHDLLSGASDVDQGETATLTIADVSYAVDGGTSSATAPAGVSLDADGHTLHVDPTNPAFDHLAVGDSTVIEVSYTVTDVHGAAVVQTETITIAGTNDVPTVTAALTDCADEGDDALTHDLLSGASDLDDGETATLTVADLSYVVDGGAPSATAPGGISLDPDGHTLHIDPSDPAFDYLADGESTVITVSYNVTDAQGATVPQTETITITGTNDGPVLTAAPQNLVDHLVEISVPVGSQDGQTHAYDDGVWSVTGTPGNLNDSSGIGYLVNPSLGNDFTTPQYSLHGHTYIAPYEPDPAKYVVTFQFDTPTVVNELDVIESFNGVTVLHIYGGNSLGSMVDLGSVVGSLGDLQGANLMYNGELNEFQFNNTTSYTYYQVVVEGTSLDNGFAFFRMTPEGPGTFTVTEAADTTGSGDADTTSGVLNFTDADHTDTHTFTVTDVAASGAGASGLPDNDTVKGWLALGAKTESTNGATGTQAWTFSAADSHFDYLADGEQVVLTYTVEIDDGHGGTATQDVTITVTGTNDAPVANADAFTLNSNDISLASNVLGNDTDVDNASLSVSGAVGAVMVGSDYVVEGTYGEITFHADGSFTYVMGYQLSQDDPVHVAQAAAYYALADGATANDVFTYTASDGQATSDATLTLTVTGQGTASLAAPQLVSESFFGGAGDQAATDVSYADGHLYLTYNALPILQQPSDTSKVASFSTAADAGPTQDFVFTWSYGHFNGVASDGANIYAVGGSHPGAGLTVDNIGGDEDKTMLARFDAGGTAGGTPAPATDYAVSNFFPGYQGVELFQDVLVTTQGGNTVLYAVGHGQPPTGSGGYIIASYDSNDNLLHTATDPLGGGFSIAYEAVEFNGQIWAIGYNQHPTGRATVWSANYDLSTVVTYEDTVETNPASFYGGAVVDDHLYAVGYAVTGGSGYQYLVAKYDTDGSVIWSTNFGGAGNDMLTDAVELNGHLYVVGSTTDGTGHTDGVLMEISTVDGSVISTTTYGGDQDDSFSSITTDGHYLYVAGESKSFTSGGNGAGEDDAILLTYDPGQGPVINTDNFEVSAAGNNSPTTVTDLSVTDPNASETLTFSAVTAEAGTGSTITPNAGSGNVSDLNADIASVTYDPGVTPPQTDMITFTVSGASGTDTVHFVFNQAGNGPGITLTGTDGKDVIFATEGNDTLTGGAGRDQFVFMPQNSGNVQHTVTDFETSLDRIDLRQFTAIDDMGDMTIAQQGNDTLITVDGHDAILLQNVHAANIHASNFIFNSGIVI